MNTCGYCGNDAQGFASINETRYCHPDEGPSCYEAQQAKNLGIRVRNGVVSAQRIAPFERRIG